MEERILRAADHSVSVRNPIAGKDYPRPLEVLDRIRPALVELLIAFDYARLARRDVWDFAVELATLRETGLTDTDCRWLVCMGYVEHARELTRLDEDGRHFQTTGNLSFARRSCLVLTEPGASFARSLLLADSTHAADAADAEAVAPVRHERQAPHWHADRHELRLDGHLVKRYRWPAVNQETVLSAFEEEGWPPRIDDPLPPLAGQNTKRKLHDTIKCLNRGQRAPLIHFRGDGTGEGIIWELVRPEVLSYGAL